MRSTPGPDSTDADEERIALLSRVASMYYEDEMTQQEISTQLGYSRSAISRFLTEARQAGVVEIHVHHQPARHAALERELLSCFGLRETRVLVSNGLPYSRMLRLLGELAARRVEQVVADESLLGVSWGTSVYEVVNAIRPPHFPGVTTLQLVGALGTPDPQIDGPELARWLAQRYGGRYQTLPAPAIVGSQAVRDGLSADPRVRKILEQMAHVDVAVVGIGSVEPSMSSLVRAGYLTVEEIGEVAAAGGVGDVCAISFDVHGSLLDIPLARRVVGIHPDVLRRIPFVLGVAGGKVKAPAILGALRAGLVNALVTDDTAAQCLLELDGQTAGGG
jgi:deoxyribonucleoside regulator